MRSTDLAGLHRERSFTLSVTEPSLRLNLAMVYLKTDRLEEARKAAFALIDRDPHLADPAHADIRAHYDRYYRPRGGGMLRVG